MITELTRETELTGRARTMRTEFDSGFAEAPGQVVLDTENVLMIRVAGEERVITLGEVAGVVVRPPITAVPTEHPAMIGIVSDRGAVAAAWDLGQLLGSGPENPRWLVIPTVEKGVAITFEHFAGFRRVDTEQIDADRRLSLAGLIMTIRELAGRA